jgi:hypothetical protein
MRVDAAKVIDAAIANDVIIELNASPWRLDMDWRLWRKAAERGLRCSINPDAHETAGLEHVTGRRECGAQGLADGRASGDDLATGQGQRRGCAHGKRWSSP